MAAEVEQSPREVAQWAAADLDKGGAWYMQRYAEAVLRRDWEALGCSAQEWAAARSKAISDAGWAVPAEQRREITALLSAEGLSLRQIAPALGVNPSTVSRDLRQQQGVADATPPPTGENSVPRVTSGQVAALPDRKKAEAAGRKRRQREKAATNALGLTLDEPAAPDGLEYIDCQCVCGELRHRRLTLAAKQQPDPGRVSTQT